MKTKKTGRKKRDFMTVAKIMAAAKKHSTVLEMQLEYVRWLRDVTCRNNFQNQFLCATAIDKLKGLY